MICIWIGIYLSCSHQPMQQYLQDRDATRTAPIMDAASMRALYEQRRKIISSSLGSGTYEDYEREVQRLMRFHHAN